MKILIVTNMYPSDELPYYGIFVKEQQDILKKSYSDLEFEVYYINGIHHKTAYPKSIYKINRMLSSGRFDLVHVHYGISGLFMLAPLAVRIPTVLTLHGGDILAEQGKTMQVALTKRILKYANKVITLNKTMDKIAQVYNPNTSIIPCSVDTDLFVPPPHRTPLSEKKEWTVIFPSAKTRTVKNYPLFKETLKLFSARYGIAYREVELNNMCRQEIVSLCQQADLMLMTSISEGSPQVIKEAMATNLPIVSTCVGDIAKLFDGTKQCACTTEHSPQALSELIYQIMNTKNDGINGREKLFNLELDSQSTARKIHDIYKQLIDNTTK